MKKSYSKDVGLLINILRNRQKIVETIQLFNCDDKSLEFNEKAIDLCSFYMAQIGESAKLLTDQTKDSFKTINMNMFIYFRNRIDHVYEKVNKKILAAYIFNMINKNTENEIKERIKFCQQNAKV